MRQARLFPLRGEFTLVFSLMSKSTNNVTDLNVGYNVSAIPGPWTVMYTLYLCSACVEFTF